jgi:hypothetical protein
LPSAVIISCGVATAGWIPNVVSDWICQRGEATQRDGIETICPQRDALYWEKREVWWTPQDLAISSTCL